MSFYRQGKVYILLSTGSSAFKGHLPTGWGGGGGLCPGGLCLGAGDFCPVGVSVHGGCDWMETPGSHYRGRYSYYSNAFLL